MDNPFFQDQTHTHVEQLKKGSTSMLAIVRARPLTPRQHNINSHPTLRVIDHNVIALLNATNQDGERKGRNRQTQFSFDFVYSEEASTKDMYDEAISGLLQGLLDGFNSTVLAYGATGCGKTYTMIGEPGHQGVIALTMIDLLGRAHQQKRYKNVIIRLSYVQIYNEIIKDLLITQDKNLQLRQDPKDGVTVVGVTQITINSMLQLATVLKVGAANRSKQATTINEASSRSHAILLVKTQTKDKAQGVKDEASIGKLSLVDLAGSQRAGIHKGARQLQGSKINRSLLALGNCIQVLAQTTNKNGFVPYRQSKLTRLLKQSLGGNCRTLLIANVSPFAGNWQETHNTLVYANRAKNIKTTVIRNVLQSDNHISSYVALIGNLKRQNDQLKRQLKVGKQHSLPQLKSAVMASVQQSQKTRIQKTIQLHFSQEKQVMDALNEITIKLDRYGFRMYRFNLQKKNNKQNSQQKQGKLKQMIQDLAQQKRKLQEKLDDMVLDRGRIVEQIKQSNTGNGVAQLMSHYRQNKIQVQLAQIKLRENRIQAQKMQKQSFLDAIGQQLQVRDKIIQQQKVIIQKNNIINRITYSKLNSYPQFLQNIDLASPRIHRSREKQPSQQKKHSGQRDKNSPSPSPKASNKIRINKASESVLSTNPVDASWYRQKQQNRGRNNKVSMPKSRGKNKRNGSKKKYDQLDLVYLQR